MNRSVRSRSNRGMALPIAITLVAALGSAALSLLVLARNELLMERGDLRYLQERSAAEGALGNSWKSNGEGGPHETPGPRMSALPAGFVLAGVSTSEAGPVHLAVGWHLDPEALARTLPGAVEVGEDPPSTGVASLEDGCPSPHTAAPLVRVRTSPSPDSPAPDPPISEPRLGMLGIERLETLGTPIHEVAENPGGESPVFLRAPPGAALSELQGFGVLVSRGDLILDGDATFRGLIILEGDLVLRDAVVVKGVVLAGGSIQIAGGARILGCPGLAAHALAQPSLQGFHPVPGGTRLGRF